MSHIVAIEPTAALANIVTMFLGDGAPAGPLLDVNGDSDGDGGEGEDSEQSRLEELHGGLGTNG